MGRRRKNNVFTQKIFFDVFRFIFHLDRNTFFAAAHVHILVKNYIRKKGRVSSVGNTILLKGLNDVERDCFMFGSSYL